MSASAGEVALALSEPEKKWPAYNHITAPPHCKLILVADKLYHIIRILFVLLKVAYMNCIQCKVNHTAILLMVMERVDL